MRGCVEDMSDLSNIPAQDQEWPGRESELKPKADHGHDTWVARGRLEGKRALVTGADSGIGRSVAVAFAKEGADVAIVDLPGSDDLQETKSLVESQGRKCVAIQADLRTAEANREAVETAVEALGGLDIIVANAGFQMSHRDISEFPPEQLHRTFETNVFSPFWLVQAAKDHLGPGASVIITTSIQAYDPSEVLLDYAATKAAANNLTVNLAQTLGPRGVRVNAVAPGPIWTPLIPSTFPEKKVEGFGTDTPLGRAGDPIEVAAAFVFLASDEASYVSGSVLGVTGGRPVF